MSGVYTRKPHNVLWSSVLQQLFGQCFRKKKDKRDHRRDVSPDEGTSDSSMPALDVMRRSDEFTRKKKKKRYDH